MIGGLPPGTAMLRAEVQPGVVFPAGSFAGALIACEIVAGSSASEVTVSTWLADVLQEAESFGACDTAQAGFEASLPFDAIQLDLAVMKTGVYACFPCAAEEYLHVFEFCKG